MPNFEKTSCPVELGSPTTDPATLNAIGTPNADADLHSRPVVDPSVAFTGSHAFSVWRRLAHRIMERIGGTWPSGPAFLLVAAICALLTYGAVTVAEAFSNDAQFWPAPGLLAALLLICRREHRAWHAAGYFVSAGLAYFLCGYGVEAAILRVTIAIGEALFLMYFLQDQRAWIDGRDDSLGSWLKFAGAALVIVPLAGAIPGGWVLGIDRGVEFSSGLRVWYTAHALSLCVMVPLLLRLRRRQIGRLIERKRIVGTIFWLVAFAVSAALVLTQSAALPLFLLMPLLIMIVFQAGFVGLVLVVSILTLLATFTLYLGIGPFLTMAPGLEWWGASSLAQLFVLVVFGTMMLIAALLEERHEREAALVVANLELASMAATDALTGVPNRRWHEREMALVWQQAQADQSSVGLLIIDIDHFKQYNDFYGHVAGDNCLRSVAAILHGETRRTDRHCARYGGEEFVVILPGASAEEARLVGDRLCRAVREAALLHEGGEFGFITVSVGAAAVRPEGAEHDSLFKLSDEALYRAKRLGRNRAERV